MASLPSQTPASPAADSPESPAAALDALSEQDNHWLDSYTSSICDFDPVRMAKETNQSMSQVLCWLSQPHVQAALELFDKCAQEGFQRRALAARMTALNSLDYLQDRITDLVELRRALALILRFIQPPRAPRPSLSCSRPPRPPPPRPPSTASPAAPTQPTPSPRSTPAKAAAKHPTGASASSQHDAASARPLTAAHVGVASAADSTPLTPATSPANPPAPASPSSPISAESPSTPASCFLSPAKPPRTPFTDYVPPLLDSG